MSQEKRWDVILQERTEDEYPLKIILRHIQTSSTIHTGWKRYQLHLHDSKYRVKTDECRTRARPC